MIYQPLKGFSTVFDATLSNEIQDGLVEYFDWALLEKGNYFNVKLNETSIEGEDMSRLAVSQDERYIVGQVWEAFRKNWVWQSGVNYSPAPLVGTNHAKPGISGVYINNIFYPSTTTGVYAHRVDYPNGRIIFNSPIPTGSKVQVEHSYKWINIVYPNSVPWLTEIQNFTFDSDGSFSQPLGQRGTYNLPPEARFQLPVIAIEIVPTRTFRGYQLGGGQWVYTDVIFHCLAEDEHTRDKLVDIVSLQNDKNIPIFDSNTINSSGNFPLDYLGTPVSGALRYPDLIEKYNGGLLRLTNTTVSNMQSFGSYIYGGIVRVKTEGIKPNI